MRAVTVGAGIIRVVVEDLDLSAGASSLSVRVVDGRVNAEYLGAVLVEVRSEREIWRQLAPGPVIRLDGLSRGELEVSVVAEGLGARSERVELLQDQRIDVRLGEGIAIAGTVTCAAGGLARPVQLHAREIATKRLSATRTDAAGRFVFAGMEPGDYLLSVDPFESDDFAQFPLRVPQSHASLVPARVRVAAGLEPAPVIVSVVPVAPLRVVVTPDTVPQTAETVWAWAQGLEFTVADDQGDSLYTGGPSGIMTAAAELLLRLPEGRYTVRVHRRGEALGERTLTTGESWRLHAP